MKKAILIILAVLSILLLSAFVYVSTGPDLPEGTNAAVSRVIQSDPPNHYAGDPGFAQNGNVSIWFEVIEPEEEPRGSVLLIMGHSASAINWPDYFYQPIVDLGYRVIRYDNRGVGLSDWMEDWEKETAYSLEDMTRDGVAILDKLNIEKAHIIGVSMGGMIAQEIAIEYQERVLSLCSIMSSGYMGDPELPEVTSELSSDFTKLAIRYLVIPSEQNVIKFGIGLAQVLRGDGDYKTDIKSDAEGILFELRNRKGYNTNVGDQHSEAIALSGSRYEQLADISAPTLVLHGTDDPLINPAHAKKYTPMITDARLVWLDGMGHDIPEKYVSKIHNAIFENFSKVNVEEEL